LTESKNEGPGLSRALHSCNEPAMLVESRRF
jgi:hypothetical protein